MSKFFTRFFILFCCFFCAQFVIAQTDSLTSQVAFANRVSVKVPVVPFYDTLFYIQANIGSFSAGERAASIAEKIKMISKERGFHRDSIKVVLLEHFAEIDYKDVVIMGITPNDAFAIGKTMYALAQEYEKLIGDAIVEHKLKNDWRYILIRVSLTIGILVVLFFFIKLINRLFKIIANKVELQKGKVIKSIKIKNYTLLDEEKTVKLTLTFLKFIRYLVILFVLFLSAPAIFSIYPPTRNIAYQSFGYILHPMQKILMSIVNYIPSLITLIIIVLVFRYLIKGLRYFAGEIAKERLKIKGFYPDWAYPTFNIVRTLLYIFMFIVIFPYLPGSESGVFKGVTVFIGVVFSLGSTSIINNVVSGLVLTYMRPFKVGDRIKIGDVVGNVSEKTPFVTRIRTPKNEEVTIPNSGIMAAQTFNYTHSAQTHKLILHTEVSFGYEVPWRKVHQLLLEAGARTANALKEPKPYILQTALDDYYAVYQINIYISDADKMPSIYSELNQHIQDVFNEAGIELMSPELVTVANSR